MNSVLRTLKSKKGEKMEAEKKKLSFHEGVILDIKMATNEEMRGILARQLTSITIPKGWDAIVEAWNQRRRELCWHPADDLGVPASLLQQKQATEEKTGLTNVSQAKACM